VYISITQYAKALVIEATDKWHTHMPKPVYEEGVVESSITHRQILQ